MTQYISNCVSVLKFTYFCVFFCPEQNSSVEGVFAPQRSTHPFRIIENDAISIQSMTSLGRVGRILAGTVDVSNSTVEKDTCSTNASSVDISATNTASSGIDFTTDRKKKSSVSSNTNDSSSNDNTSNSTMMLQG